MNKYDWFFIVKVPKYQLENSLYTALLTKLEHKPLRLCWTSNDIVLHTIGKGVTQDVINVHSKPLRIFVGLMGMTMTLFCIAEVDSKSLFMF